MRAVPFLLAAAVLLNVLPAVGAQTPIASCSRECDPVQINGGQMKTGTEITKVILYGHFKNALDQAPLNTQAPHKEHERDLNAPFFMPVLDTNTQAGCSVGNCLDFHFKSNEFKMVSSPGLVEYLNDDWRTHQEPGLAGDAKIAGTEFNLYFYLSSYAIPLQNSYSQYPDVGATPQVGIYARMETGRHAFNSKSILLAEAATGIAEPLAPQRVNMVTTPNEPDVYEFQVPMKVVKDTIPSDDKLDGFIVYVSPYQVRTAVKPSDGHQVMQESWRLRTGANFPPRLVLPIEETMKTVASSLSIFERLMYVRWSLISVWGSYDMKDNDITLVSTGPNKVPDKAMDLLIVKRSVDHDAHFKPVNVTWQIDFGLENPDFKLADGDYELTATIPNLQGTYLLVQKFPFKVVGGVPDVPLIGRAARAAGGGPAGAGAEAAESPGFDGLILLAAVAALALALRRR